MRNILIKNNYKTRANEKPHLKGDMATQAPSFLMHEHDATLSQNAAQYAMQIASLAQQIDGVLHMGKNNQACVGQQSGLVGTSSSRKLGGLIFDRFL